MKKIPASPFNEDLWQWAADQKIRISRASRFPQRSRRGIPSITDALLTRIRAILKKHL